MTHLSVKYTSSGSDLDPSPTRADLPVRLFYVVDFSCSKRSAESKSRRGEKKREQRDLWFAEGGSEGEGETLGFRRSFERYVASYAFASSDRFDFITIDNRMLLFVGSLIFVISFDPFSRCIVIHI